MKNSIFGVLVAGLFVVVPLALAQPQPQASNLGKVTGTVLETTNAGSYTYVLVNTGKEKVWAAAPQFQVKVGDKVSFTSEMAMKNFESKTLNRKFDVVYFAPQIDGPGTKAQAAAAGQAAHAVPNDPAHASLRNKPAAPIDFTGLKKADGGLTIAELYQQKSKLEKKQVTFRGKVVKYNAEIMNKNWAHVQDGTGAPGANDVTVTTSDTVKVGDTVLVKGTVVLNKDYGYGYKYGLLVDNAKITVEQKAKP